MESDACKIFCKCGNTITFDDCYDSGFKFPCNIKIQCTNCDKMFFIQTSDEIDNLTGATNVRYENKREVE